jgi:hypothetical protein
VPTSKTFFTSGLLFAYLLVGSGHYVAKSFKADGRRETIAFAGTIPRKVYQYSVVPGGVFTPEELRAARRADPVVAMHFADFGQNTTLTTLKEDMYVYVSYRKGDKVYYTKKKHKVCKGEVVITDGKNYARTRCANRLSKIFRPPALAFDEPQAPQFDYVDPPASPDVVVTNDPLLATNYYGLPDGSGYAPPPAQQAQTGANPGPPVPAAGYETANGPIYPQLLPLGGTSPALFIPPNKQVVVVVVTPEPAEWPSVLVSFGVLSFLWLRNRQKRVA